MKTKRALDCEDSQRPTKKSKKFKKEKAEKSHSKAKKHAVAKDKAEEENELPMQADQNDPVQVDDEDNLPGSDDDDDNESVGEGPQRVGTDPFSSHFENEIPDNLAESLLPNTDPKIQKQLPVWAVSDVVVPDLGKAELFTPTDVTETLPAFDETDLIKLHVKKSLVDQLPTANVWNTSGADDSDGNGCLLSKLQLALFRIMNSYKDLYYPHRTHKNGEEIRLAYCLHALNHVLKTRNRVVRHNKKMENNADTAEEYRDQGLTRPKVLIVLPFRDSALKVVRLMMKLLSNREYTVSSKHRFESEYGSEGDAKRGLKPEDFEAIFDGNNDDKFRIGISISKKALKLYEDFYSSDIILASPLGLAEVIKSEGEKDRDFEFLSSIEVLAIDQLDVLLMQNFEYVMLVLNSLHVMPKETHGVDYFRVRMWSLNGWSKVYRQTLLFGSVTHPIIETIFRRHCLNYSGKLKLLNLPSVGTVENVQTANPLVQIFQRVNVSSVQESPDARFEFFTKKILPHYIDQVVSGQTMIFLSSYFDFVRLRNHFAKEEKNGSGATFAVLSEYLGKGGISKARQHFHEGKIRFMLFSERFHFYHRFKIRGIQHLIFYDLPTYAHFYPELCNMITDSSSEAIEKLNQSVTVLFSKYDVDRLIPVVGYEKACELITPQKNVSTFHSK